MAEVIDVLKIDIDPNDCPFHETVCIAIEFESKGVSNATWQVEYEVDATGKRHVMELCSVGPLDYDAGHHTVDLKIPGVNIEGVKERKLMAMGILKCRLMSNGDEAATVNLVTQVSRADDGQLIRTMMNPLE